MPIVVNGAFRPQRTTGQQRYAAEIADRLVRAGAQELRPSAAWSRSSLRSWLWCLLVLPWRSRHAVLVTLTARTPLWHPRHVVAVHDLFVLTNPEWYSRSYVWSHVPLLRWQLRTASAVVAVSAPVAEQIRSTRANAGTVGLAPNAPSELFMDPAVDDAMLDRLQIQPGAFLLTIGSMDPRKNLVRLSRAWAEVPAEVRQKCPLVIVGGGAAIYAQGAISWPAGTVVPGYVSDEELAGLYRVAKGVVFVSLAEGFGLPIVEAAAAGVRRFLLSDIQVFHWIAGRSATYVDPLSVHAMTAALRAMVEAEEQPAEAVDTSRFLWEESAAEVMASARRVADSSSGV